MVPSSFADWLVARIEVDDCEARMSQCRLEATDRFRDRRVHDVIWQTSFDVEDPARRLHSDQVVVFRKFHT